MTQEQDLLSRLIAAEAEVGRLRDALEYLRVDALLELPNGTLEWRGVPDIGEWFSEVLIQPTPTTGLLELARAAIRVDNIEQIWESDSSPGAWTTELAEECKAAKYHLHRCHKALPQDLKNLLERM